MRLSDPWPITTGTLGILIANVLLISMRSFASRTGLEVRWWSRSFDRERNHLRRLAASTDVTVARQARRYLRLEVLAWAVGVAALVVFFWGVLGR